MKENQLANVGHTDRKGAQGQDQKIPIFFLIIFLINITFFLPVREMLEAYCCLLCVLSYDMSNVSIGIFS